MSEPLRVGLVAEGPTDAVVCMPSKSTEAWVVAMLFPNDLAMRKGIECFPDVEMRLGQQPVAQRLRKKRRDYLERAGAFTAEWPRIAAEGGLGEARRFESEFLAVLRGA